MINWWPVFTNALWIMGLAAALASLSWADWLAANDRRDLRSVAKHLAHSSSFALTIALTAFGISLSVATWWERLVWLLLAAGFAAHTVRARFRQRKDANGGRSGTTS